MAMQIGEEVAIVGTYRRAIYEADNFYILAVEAPYDPDKFPSECQGRDEFVAKGRFSAPDYKGQMLEFVGEWGYDQKYKSYALAVQYTIPSLPDTREGTIKFLKSVRGIGQKLADRISTAFHDNLKTATLDEDWMTATIKGMSQSKAVALCGAIRRVNAIAELTKLLRDAVPGETIRRISSKYGSKAIDMVTGSAYKMAEDYAISFKEADAVALALGWAQDSEDRLRTGIICTMRSLKSQKASIIVEKSKLQAAAIRTLGVDSSILAEVMEKLYKEKILVSAAEYCYLYNDYLTERQLSEKVVSYCRAKISPSESAHYLKKFEEWKREHADIALAEKQEEAVKAVSSNSLSVITGGPGTGKTATLKSVLETYRKAFPKSNITLMAPTGFASKRMAAACSAPAATIHKTLGLIPAEGEAEFDDSDGLSIDGGLVIIDEFSMVGIHLAKFLFEAVVFKPDTRIVIVGDVDQLPPVSPGMVLADLISCGCVKVTRLDRNFRQEAGSEIIDGAHAINAGNTNLDLGVGNFQYKEISNEDIAIETASILEEVKKAFVWSIKHFGLAQTFILAPQRKNEVRDGKTLPKTLLSTQSLNPILRDIANPPSSDKAFYKIGNRIFRTGDKVMNKKNTEAVQNGEIGVIKRIETDDVPVIVVDFDGCEMEYTPDMLKQLDLAYAISVHKSQGSEYDSVIYPTSMAQGRMLQRNLLYTAVTRAKKNIVLIGSRESIYTAIRTRGDGVKRDLLSARIARAFQRLAQSDGNIK